MEENEKREDYLLSDIGETTFDSNIIKDDDVYKYTCPNCGSSFYRFSTDDICLYCGEKCNTLNEKTDYNDIFCLPFDKSIEDAKSIYKKYIRFKLLIPIIFRKKGIVDNIKKVYVPILLRDCNVNGNIIFYAADNDKKNTLSKYEVCYKVNVDFDNVFLSLYSKLDNETISVMNNYNFDNLKEFASSDINDSSCIISDIDNDSSNEKLNLYLNKYVTGLVRDDINHNLKKVKDNTTKIEVKSEKKVLIPAYILNVNDNICFINGQNGEIFINYTIRKKYVLIFSLVCFILIFILVFLLAWII